MYEYMISKKTNFYLESLHDSSKEFFFLRVKPLIHYGKIVG